MLSTKYLGMTCSLRDEQLRKYVQERIGEFLQTEFTVLEGVSSYGYQKDSEMYELSDGSEVRPFDLISFTQIFKYCLLQLFANEDGDIVDDEAISNYVYIKEPNIRKGIRPIVKLPLRGSQPLKELYITFLMSKLKYRSCLEGLPSSCMQRSSG